MKSAPSSPIVKHLVLIGGGHSHLAVLKRLGMKPVPGLAITLISREITTPYSGSLPGFITGHYSHEQIHIDLRPLAQFAGARIIEAEITQIDLQKKTILCANRPSIEFDLLSLNIGSRPNASLIPGAELYATGVKPIDAFLQRWQQIYTQALATLQDTKAEFTIAIVGGGPASVELALAAQYRILSALKLPLRQPNRLRIKLISADAALLMGHNSKVRKFAESEFASRHIEVLLAHRVVEFKAGTVVCAEHQEIKADVILFATGASIADWPGRCGLALSADGFIEVNEFLQSTNHACVFVAGDAATLVGEPRPKSGVYAVRQGKPLAENLVRYATGKKLQRYKPQQHALALINLGNKTAIASRNQLFFKGRWVWSLKNWIDTGFIRKYSELPQRKQELTIAPGLLDPAAEEQLRQHAMRCAGCGAKVAGNILDDVLQQLPMITQPDVISSESRVEDAALIRLDNNRVLLQSIDQVSAFINDPYLFARIATNHCLSDIYAMGCQPHSALAVVGLPFASKRYQKAQLRELMLGCSAALLENNCSLIGGHSAESPELSFGLSVNGFAQADQLLTKHGMTVGDVIILSKPLGTGTLLAADMRYRAKHSWITQALTHMLQSNRAAAQCFQQNGATACTDITGFGLAGHLLEMLEFERVEVEIELEQVPAMEGALACLQQGIFSSLHQDNAQKSTSIYNSEAFRDDRRYDLLFDPQTSGGLVASVPAQNAAACLQQLHGAGCTAARIIGWVASSKSRAPALILK